MTEHRATAEIDVSESLVDRLDGEAIRYARVLPLDVVQNKGSGHAGTAVSLTPAIYTLFQHYLRHDPADPAWLGRDRFVLSCGHASLALYVQLYLSGYGLTMDDLRATRKLGSLTPGHPEYRLTPGVETTTGPLGQGLANAVGIAMATTRLSAMLEPESSPDERLFASRVWCFASDGDMQEGITHEASSFAAAVGLSNLVVLWDDNGISIEGVTSNTFTEDVVARYVAYGWRTLEIDDADDVSQIRTAFDSAVEADGRPVLIRMRSRIGSPMPSLTGTAAAHAGPPGADEVAGAKRALGLDPNQSFHMPAEILAHTRRLVSRGKAHHDAWNSRFTRWAADHSQRAETLRKMQGGGVPDTARAALAELRADPKPVATRKASAAVLNVIVPTMPGLWGGSADLAESNGTDVTGAASFYGNARSSAQWPGGPDGALVHFGIREHAMGAITSGMVLGGPFRAFAATYFVFSDYMRPAVRLASLMRLPVIYVWSHDSVAVGEDGPTHQPVEQLWSARSIPGLTVARPADWVETVDCWSRALDDVSGPVALVLGRQSVPIISPTGIGLDSGAIHGAYVIADSDSATPEVIIIATGSEVNTALSARERLAQDGIAARVVSAPCLSWFDQEDVTYRERVLPRSVRARVSVEAGARGAWRDYVGDAGEIVSIDRFGASGDGAAVLEQSGISVETVLAAARRSMSHAKLLA